MPSKLQQPPSLTLHPASAGHPHLSVLPGNTCQSLRAAEVTKLYLTPPLSRTLSVRAHQLAAATKLHQTPCLNSSVGQSLLATAAIKLYVTACLSRTLSRKSLLVAAAHQSILPGKSQSKPISCISTPRLGSTLSVRAYQQAAAIKLYLTTQSEQCSLSHKPCMLAARPPSKYGTTPGTLPQQRSLSQTRLILAAAPNMSMGQYLIPYLSRVAHVKPWLGLVVWLGGGMACLPRPPAGHYSLQYTSHWLIHSFIHAFMLAFHQSFIQSFIHSRLHSFHHSFMLAFNHLFILCFFLSFVPSFLPSYTRSFISIQHLSSPRVRYVQSC